MTNGWRRTGGFLIGLGLFLLVLFVISDSVSQPEFGLLAGGAGGIGLGSFFLVTHPKPKAPPAPRFRLIRGIKDEPVPKKEAKPPAPPKGEGSSKPGPGGAPAKAGAGKGGPPKGKPGSKK